MSEISLSERQAGLVAVVAEDGGNKGNERLNARETRWRALCARVRSQAAVGRHYKRSQALPRCPAGPGAGRRGTGWGLPAMPLPGPRRAGAR